MADRVRIGVIGCGNIGKTHARAFAALAGADLAATCDADGARAEALAEAHGVRHVFTDVGELLRSGTVDAVTVCTPHPTHADVVVAAAAAGVHVICEKPLAVEIGEANRMVEAEYGDDVEQLRTVPLPDGRVVLVTGENVEFFDLTYQDPQIVSLDMAFEAVAPLLWLRAGSKGRRIDINNGSFDVADTYSILFDVDYSG